MFDFDFDDLFNPLLLDWDKKNYKFNREEKDMHPYSTIHKDNMLIITHNILGIDKKDLDIKKEDNNGTVTITIKGKTKDSISGKEYSIDSRFAIGDNNLDTDNIEASSRNGLLYLIIPKKLPKKEQNKLTSITIK